MNDTSFSIRCREGLAADPLTGMPLAFNDLDAAQACALLLTMTGVLAAAEVIETPHAPHRVIESDEEIELVCSLLAAEKRLRSNLRAQAGHLN